MCLVHNLCDKIKRQARTVSHHLVSADARKRHVDYVAPSVASQGFDQGGLSSAGGSVQQKPELVGVPLDGVLACTLPTVQHEE